MSTNPSTNEERCSNCGTINPIGQDKCVKCEMPLTASADEAVRTNMESQGDTAVMGGRNDITILGSGLPAANTDRDAARGDIDMPIMPERPA